MRILHCKREPCKNPVITVKTFSQTFRRDIDISKSATGLFVLKALLEHQNILC